MSLLQTIKLSLVTVLTHLSNGEKVLKQKYESHAMFTAFSMSF